jgi:hypothetical protein
MISILDIDPSEATSSTLELVHTSSTSITSRTVTYKCNLITIRVTLTKSKSLRFRKRNFHAVDRLAKYLFQDSTFAIKFRDASNNNILPNQRFIVDRYEAHYLEHGKINRILKLRVVDITEPLWTKFRYLYLIPFPDEVIVTVLEQILPTI